MKVKTKEIRDLTAILDDIVQQYKEKHPTTKRNWRTYEEKQEVQNLPLQLSNGHWHC